MRPFINAEERLINYPITICNIKSTKKGVSLFLSRRFTKLHKLKYQLNILKISELFCYQYTKPVSAYCLIFQNKKIHNILAKRMLFMFFTKIFIFCHNFRNISGSSVSNTYITPTTSKITRRDICKFLFNYEIRNEILKKEIFLKSFCIKDMKTLNNYYLKINKHPLYFGNLFFQGNIDLDELFIYSEGPGDSVYIKENKVPLLDTTVSTKLFIKSTIWEKLKTFISNIHENNTINITIKVFPGDSSILLYKIIYLNEDNVEIDRENITPILEYIHNFMKEDSVFCYCSLTLFIFHEIKLLIDVFESPENMKFTRDCLHIPLNIDIPCFLKSKWLPSKVSLFENIEISMETTNDKENNFLFKLIRTGVYNSSVDIKYSEITGNMTGNAYNIYGHISFDFVHHKLMFEKQTIDEYIFIKRVEHNFLVELKFEKKCKTIKLEKINLEKIRYITIEFNMDGKKTESLMFEYVQTEEKQYFCLFFLIKKPPRYMPLHTELYDVLDKSDGNIRIKVWNSNQIFLEYNVVFNGDKTVILSKNEFKNLPIFAIENNSSFYSKRFDLNNMNILDKLRSRGKLNDINDYFTTQDKVKGFDWSEKKYVRFRKLSEFNLGLATIPESNDRPSNTKKVLANTSIDTFSDEYYELAEEIDNPEIFNNKFEVFIDYFNNPIEVDITNEPGNVFSDNNFNLCTVVEENKDDLFNDTSKSLSTKTGNTNFRTDDTKLSTILEENEDDLSNSDKSPELPLNKQLDKTPLPYRNIYKSSFDYVECLSDEIFKNEMETTELNVISSKSDQKEENCELKTDADISEIGHFRISSKELTLSNYKNELPEKNNFIQIEDGGLNKQQGKVNNLNESFTDSVIIMATNIANKQDAKCDAVCDQGTMGLKHVDGVHTLNDYTIEKTLKEEETYKSPENTHILENQYKNLYIKASSDIKPSTIKEPEPQSHEYTKTMYSYSKYKADNGTNKSDNNTKLNIGDRGAITPLRVNNLTTFDSENYENFPKYIDRLERDKTIDFTNNPIYSEIDDFIKIDRINMINEKDRIVQKKEKQKFTHTENTDIFDKHSSLTKRHIVNDSEDLDFIVHENTNNLPETVSFSSTNNENTQSDKDNNTSTKTAVFIILLLTGILLFATILYLRIQP